MKIWDRIFGCAGLFASIIVLAGFGAIAWYLGSRGIGNLSPGFLTKELEDAGRAGGIGPILVSTFLILLVCLATALPLGLTTAIWLSEFAAENQVSRLIRAFIDVLASIPSIVFGLFGMVFFCQALGLGFSIAAGGLTLACMILPIIIRTSLIGLSIASDEIRAGSAALGMSRTTTTRRLLLPLAFPGFIIGATLGISRALAETAALIFTSGYATRWPTSLEDSGRSISVHIYDLAMNVPGGARNAAASALALLVILLVINSVAQVVADRFFKESKPTRS